MNQVPRAMQSLFPTGDFHRGAGVQCWSRSCSRGRTNPANAIPSGHPVG